MKRAICNQCRKEGELTTYGGVPDGWWTLHLADRAFKADEDFCSVACLATRVTALTSVEGVVADVVASGSIQ